MRFDVMPVATEKQIKEVVDAAYNVWHNYYKDIFTTEQINYMLEKYQSHDALRKQMSEGLKAQLSLAKHEFHFAHSLGQNFILDDALIARILDEAGVGEGDCVLEIGAGAGVMTAALADRCQRVLALEVDRRLEPVLRDVLDGRPVSGQI